MSIDAKLAEFLGKYPVLLQKINLIKVLVATTDPRTRNKKYDKAYRQKLKKLKRKLQPNLTLEFLRNGPKEGIKAESSLNSIKHESSDSEVKLENPTASPVLIKNVSRNFEAIPLAQYRALESTSQPANEEIPSNQINQTGDKVLPHSRKLHREEAFNPNLAETVSIIPEKIISVTGILTEGEELKNSEREDTQPSEESFTAFFPGTSRQSDTISEQNNTVVKKKQGRPALKKIIRVEQCNDIGNSPSRQGRRQSSRLSKKSDTTASKSLESSSLNLYAEKEKIKTHSEAHASSSGQTIEKPEDKSPVPLKALSIPVVRLTSEQISSATAVPETSSSNNNSQDTSVNCRRSSRITETTYQKIKETIIRLKYKKHH